ncbi:MAG: trypsin-like peptidase domain-containing protein [Clostridia bacterium]|nr:trypsin-like peptidase domain-containing protein [Clostridia bacterium]
MSDNHEKYYGTQRPENENPVHNSPQSGQPTYGTYSQPSAPQSYTWNAQTGEYSSGPYRQTYGAQTAYPQQVKSQKKTKKGVPFGVKLLAVILCCALTSAATLGVFIALLQTGTVTLKTESTVQLPESSEGQAVTLQPTPQTSSASGALLDQDIAEKVLPSVVCIQNYQITQQYGFLYTSSGGDTSPAGEGSGIVLNAEGYIVTNAHVVNGATSLKVIFYDGSVHEAELVGIDTLTDLAVIKVNTQGEDAAQVVPADFGQASGMRVADKVMAIGNPGGSAFSSSVTIGYVSALNRAIPNQDTGYTMEYIQTDAAINPGNSGGALVNGYGQVIGINTAKISATEYEGLGFAIPTDFAQPIIDDLIEFGYVKDRAMLGISGQYLDALTGRFYGLPQGEYVSGVTTEYAQASGLKKGDVITAIDGMKLSAESVIRGVVNNKKPGDTVTLTVYRPSTRETGELTLTLSEYSGS